MNFAEFVTEYKNVNFDVFAFAYFKALEDLVGEEQAKKYVSETIKEKQLVKDAAAVINKLSQNNVSITKDDFLRPSNKDSTTYVTLNANGNWSDTLNPLSKINTSCW